MEILALRNPLCSGLMLLHRVRLTRRAQTSVLLYKKPCPYCTINFVKRMVDCMELTHLGRVGQLILVLSQYLEYP